MSSKNESGYVYLASGGGYCKIGRSKNVENRIVQISGRLPFEIDSVYYLETDDMFTVEKALHSHFAHKRGKGEWFNLSTDDIDWFRSWDGNLSDIKPHDRQLHNHNIEFVLNKVGSNRIYTVALVILAMVCLAASLFPVVDVIERGDVAFGPSVILLLALSVGVGIFKFVLIHASVMTDESI